jgi:hypothetical protein
MRSQYFIDSIEELILNLRRIGIDGRYHIVYVNMPLHITCAEKMVRAAGFTSVRFAALATVL